MKTTYKAVCEYDDGTKDTATVVITSEGAEIYQVAWEISNGEKDRAVLEATSNDEAFEIWCEENGFEPAS
ncbi:MAG: hypothetical protein J0I20_16135 [Chloroflexi bacterium]|nr:hypothetical protein [Chloroflexota bacterium]OJV88684.1 MAG: hypothetical protein BGO39_04025 [Chloroflexi bacterium 54-19]